LLELQFHSSFLRWTNFDQTIQSDNTQKDRRWWVLRNNAKDFLASFSHQIFYWYWYSGPRLRHKE